MSLAREIRDFQGDRAPTTLDGVSVRVDGIPAPTAYAGPGQINFQAPAGLVPGSTAAVDVVRGGAVSSRVAMAVMPASPALLTTPSFLDGVAGANPHFRLADILGITVQLSEGLVAGDIPPRPLSSGTSERRPPCAGSAGAPRNRLTAREFTES